VAALSRRQRIANLRRPAASGSTKASSPEPKEPLDMVLVTVGVDPAAVQTTFPKLAVGLRRAVGLAALDPSHALHRHDDVAVVAGSLAELRRALPLLDGAGRAVRVSIAVLDTDCAHLMRVPHRLPDLMLREARIAHTRRGSILVTVRTTQPAPVSVIARAVLGGSLPAAVGPCPAPVLLIGSTHVPPVDTALICPAGFRVDWDRDEARLTIDGPTFNVQDGTGSTLLTGDSAVGLTERHIADLRVFGRLQLDLDETVAAPGARLLSQLACAGMPTHASDLPAGARQALGDDLVARLAGDPAILADPTAREDWSVGTRRIALARFGPWAPGGSAAHPPSVSVILPSCRPGFVAFALAQVARQDWAEVQAVLVLHGVPADEPGVAAAIAAYPRPLEVVEVPADVVFGEALNRGLARCAGHLITKMDDDDWYGPHHLTDLVQARMYSGVTLTGLGGFWMYLGDSDTTLWRVGDGEARVGWVHGGTTLLAADDLRAVGGWQAVGVGEDLQLQRSLLAAGAEFYSIHGLGFLYYRGHDHTYVVAAGDQEWLARADYPRVAGFRPPPQLVPLSHPGLARH